MTDLALGGGFGQRLREVSFAPLAVYGLLIYTVLLGVLEEEADSVGEIVSDSVITQIVFFAAHVFAHTLGTHSEHGLRQGTVRAIRHSAPMLYAAIPPLLVLVVCWVAGVHQDAAVNAAIVTSALILVVLGYLAWSRRTSNLVLRILGGLGTGLLGLIIMAFEYAVH